MQEQLIEFFYKYDQLAVFISLLASTVVAILGILPSFFITASNIAFFGFWPGVLISMAGEIIGAAAAFYLYRKGLRKSSVVILEKHPWLKRLISSEGGEAFYLILVLRILPFIPSGFVTLAGAVGKVSPGVFLTASSLGKIPALFIEALTVYQVRKISWLWETAIYASLIFIIYKLWQRWKNRA